MAHRFERVGGHPVLDFLNTINDWTADTPTDYLADGSAAAAFGEQAGVLSRAESRRMASLLHGPELGRLKTLRALLERVLQALVDAGAPAAADLDVLDALRTEVSRAAKLRPVEGRLTSDVSAERAGAATLRLRLAAGAFALLESPSLPRLKRCPSCAWFFLDVSKNGSRRWCSMATCGATAKAHRYYWKDREPGA